MPIIIAMYISVMARHVYICYIASYIIVSYIYSYIIQVQENDKFL